MNQTLKVFILAAIPFGLALGLVTGLRSGLSNGLGAGVICGLLFGIAIAGFVHYQTTKFQKLRPKYEAEGLVLDGGANLGGNGGFLFLTKQRLVFEPHGANSKSAKRVEIPLADIKEVKPAGGKLIRRFEVVTAGTTHSFLVENRDAWLEAFLPLLAWTANPSAS
jgi:hypothetical protein